MSKIRMGQVSLARHALTGAALAPKTEETFNLLQERRPQEQVRPIPEEMLAFVPEEPLQLQKKVFFKCLREAPSGSSAGPGGCSNKILRVCLDDGWSLQLLHLAAQDFARGEAPREVTQLFMMATTTALRKPDGGVRGIATGTVFRRLLAKCVSRQHITEVEKVHPCRHRLRGSCCAGDDEFQSKDDCLVNRRYWCM